jgi:anti-sigma B factor antagonist
MTAPLPAATFSAVACPEFDTIRIAAAGEIDLATAPQLKAVLLAAIEQPFPPRDVRIDLAEVTFMDASGIGVLISGREAARCRGLGFTVQNPQGVVLRVFEILRLTGRLTLSPARR